MNIPQGGGNNETTGGTVAAIVSLIWNVVVEYSTEKVYFKQEKVCSVGKHPATHWKMQFSSSCRFRVKPEDISNS